jgi:hypothetical protein
MADILHGSAPYNAARSIRAPSVERDDGLSSPPLRPEPNNRHEMEISDDDCGCSYEPAQSHEHCAHAGRAGDHRRVPPANVASPGPASRVMARVCQDTWRPTAAFAYPSTSPPTCSM